MLINIFVCDFVRDYSKIISSRMCRGLLLMPLFWALNVIPAISKQSLSASGKAATPAKSTVLAKPAVLPKLGTTKSTKLPKSAAPSNLPKSAVSSSSHKVAPAKRDSSLTVQWLNAPKNNPKSWNREKIGDAFAWQIYWMERTKVLKLLGQPTLSEENSSPGEDSGQIDYYQLNSQDNKRLKVSYTDENRVITSGSEDASCQPRVYLGELKDGDPLLSTEKLKSFLSTGGRSWDMVRDKARSILGAPITSYKYSTRENGASLYWLEDVYALSKDGRKVFVLTYYDNPGQSENRLDCYKLETIAQDYQPKLSTKAKRLAHAAVLANAFSAKEWLDAVKPTGNWSRQKQVDTLLTNCEVKGMPRAKVLEMLGEPQLTRIITPADKSRSRRDSYLVSSKNEKSLSINYDNNDVATSSYLSDDPCAFDPVLSPGKLTGGRISLEDLKSKLVDKYTKDQLALKTQDEIRAIIGQPAYSLAYTIPRPHGSPTFTDDIYVLSEDGRTLFLVTYGQQRKTGIDSQIVTIGKDCPQGVENRGAMSIFF